MHITAQDRIKKIKDLECRSEVRELLLSQMEYSTFEKYFQSPASFYYSHGEPGLTLKWPAHNKRKLLPLWEFQDRIYALDVLDDVNEVISFHSTEPEQYDVYNSIDHAIFELIALHVDKFDEAKQATEFAKKLQLPNYRWLPTLFCKYMGCTKEEFDEYIEKLN